MRRTCAASGSDTIGRRIATRYSEGCRPPIPSGLGNVAVFTSESVAAFRRNGWPTCVGINGRIGSEYAGGLVEAADQAYTNCFSGTSSATPLVAGTAGLVLTANPAFTRIQLQRLLQDTADKIEDSVGSYATDNGCSAPGGTPTHAFGRINAFEAVRVAAPVAQGGKAGVDTFMRVNRLDWGNTEQPSNTLFEATRGYIGHWRSEDIKVDAPPYAAAPTAATFDSFVDETLSAAPGASIVSMFGCATVVRSRRPKST